MNRKKILTKNSDKPLILISLTYVILRQENCDGG